MACNAQDLLSAAAASGYFKLSQRGLVEAIASAYSIGASSTVFNQFILAVNTDKYLKLSERDLMQGWLSAAGSEDARTLYTQAVAQGVHKLSERNLWEVILQAISGAPAQDWETADAPAHKLSFRDLLMVIVEAAGGGNAQNLENASQSKGYGKFSHRMILECLAFQLCMNPPNGGNIVPGGSVCNAGSFTLNVKANTTYQITWGTETQVNICGTIYASPGVGNATIVYTGPCTTMVFSCGAGAITTRVQPSSKTPIPSGFTWTKFAGLATATWDSPPGFVTQTELWTSTDNVTFVLAATVAAPGTSSPTQAVGFDDILYAKIRWIAPTGTPVNGPFASTLSVTSYGRAWHNQVVTNGGAVPSNNSIQACDVLMNGMESDGVITKMAYILGFPNDSLIAALTPLYNGVGGNVLATNTGPFLLADLTVNGLKGDGVGKYLKLGFSPSTLSAYNGLGDFGSMLIAVYCSDVAGGTGTFDTGAVDAVVNHQVLMSTDTANISIFDNPFNGGNGRLSYAHPAGQNGLYTGNRTATNNQEIWFGAALPGLQLTNAINQVGNPPPAVEFYCFTVNNNNGAPFTPIDRRLSMVVYGGGLTAGQMANFGPRLRAYRTSIGGGNPG